MKGLFIRVFVGIFIFFILFKVKILSLPEILSSWKSFRKIYFFYCFVILLFIVLFCILRWRYFLKKLGINVSFLKVFMATLAGMFFNIVSPSLIVGDFYKSFRLVAETGKLATVVHSVILDRLSGWCALVIIGVLSFIFGKNLILYKNLILPLTLVILVSIFFCVLIFNRRLTLLLIKVLKDDWKIKQRILALHNEFYSLKDKFFIFMGSLYFSFVVQFLSCVFFWVAAKGFGVETKLIYFLILVPIISIITSLPITIAGLGTGQIAAVTFFGLVGIDKNVSANVMFINSALWIFFGLIGGIIYTFGLDKLKC